MCWGKWASTADAPRPQGGKLTASQRPRGSLPPQTADPALGTLLSPSVVYNAQTLPRHPNSYFRVPTNCPHGIRGQRIIGILELKLAQGTVVNKIQSQPWIKKLASSGGFNVKMTTTYSKTLNEMDKITNGPTVGARS